MSRGKARAARQRPRPVWQIVGLWLGSLLSVGLLYLVGSAVDSDLGSFRSCSTNSSGLTISNCGKQGLNFGDVILLALFALAACLVVTMFTAAWRTTRGRTV
jgi:hypothetical protein